MHDDARPVRAARRLHADHFAWGGPCRGIVSLSRPGSHWNRSGLAAPSVMTRDAYHGTSTIGRRPPPDMTRVKVRRASVHRLHGEAADIAPKMAAAMPDRKNRTVVAAQLRILSSGL